MVKNFAPLKFDGLTKEEWGLTLKLVHTNKSEMQKKRL